MVQLYIDEVFSVINSFIQHLQSAQQEVHLQHETTPSGTRSKTEQVMQLTLLDRCTHTPCLVLCIHLNNSQLVRCCRLAKASGVYRHPSATQLDAAKTAPFVQRHCIPNTTAGEACDPALCSYQKHGVLC